MAKDTEKIGKMKLEYNFSWHVKWLWEWASHYLTIKIISAVHNTLYGVYMFVVWNKLYEREKEKSNSC